ncbi:MAG TPA: RNA 2',3'-cyclic phosphodiesterase [Burkholderiales bacterium]|nr:RNA 2',3'-cyclic phosphodiesterase [Burkholderiales bacterium]
MRLFFALWPPPATARALEAWAQEVRRDTGGRVIPAASIHLTLAFLGDADPARASAAARTVSGPRHDLPLEEARYVKRNQIVWASPRVMPDPLARLAADLHAALAAAGLALEPRPFAAHVTLLRKARAPRALPDLPSLSWPVDAFTLVASTLSSDGSRYEQLQSFALASPQRGSS